MAMARIANARAVGGAASFKDAASVVAAYASDVDVVAEAIDALAVIALRCAEVRNTSAGRVAIGPIIDSLRAHSSHAKVVVAASRAVFAITANASYKPLFYDAGAGPLLMTAFSTHVAVEKRSWLSAAPSSGWQISLGRISTK